MSEPVGVGRQISDDENLHLTGDAAAVDRINGSFYGAFPYPWRPQNFIYPADAGLTSRALAQSVGDWSCRRLPARPSIWIAGCGTNQAAHIALEFPFARIVASDLSEPSLELCARTLKQMRLRNVELRCESLNDVRYEGQFDFIISTGVIHHNADPAAALARLQRALKPGGLMEIMVYNRFHRRMNTAVQKAMLLLGGADGTWDERMALLREMGAALPADSPTTAHWARLRDHPPACVADCLLQPVEHSYTVESFGELAESCGMRLVTYRLSEWDKADGRMSWNMRWTSPELQRRYDALPDRARWQITNLLQDENSPMLWFYLQRDDSPYPILSEAEMTAQFLDRPFALERSEQRCYVLSDLDEYELSTRELAPQQLPTDGPWKALARAIGGGLTPRQALAEHGLPADFDHANRARVFLATTAFPTLMTRPNEQVAGASRAASAPAALV